jgi:hypothetical protein
MMHPATRVTAFAFVLAAALDAGAQEKVGDLEKALDKTLSMRLDTSMENVALEDYISLLETFLQKKIAFFIDAAEVQDPSAIVITSDGKDTMFEVLKKNLKSVDLVPVPWDGVIVVTTAKGAAQFKDADWCGLGAKALAPHAGLRGKLDAVTDFDWSPFDPRKGLEVLSTKSGVAIDASRLSGDEARNPDKHLLYPRRVALRTALVCLARVTGITYEVGKDGTLKALPPKKQKGARAPGTDGPLRLALSLAPGDRFSVALSERLGPKEGHHFHLERVIDYAVEDVSAEGLATLKGSYRKFGFHARAIFNDAIEPEDVDILWEAGEFRQKSEHRLYTPLVEQAVRKGVALKVDRRGRARTCGSAPVFQNLEVWGAGQLLGLPACLPEEPLRSEETWAYAGKASPATMQGKLLRCDGDVAVLSLKLQSTQKQSAGEILETRYDGDVLVRFDAKRGLPREMKGICHQSVVRNQTQTLFPVSGGDVEVDATITPAR